MGFGPHGCGLSTTPEIKNWGDAGSSGFWRSDSRVEGEMSVSWNSQGRLPVGVGLLQSLER